MDLSSDDKLFSQILEEFSHPSFNSEDYARGFFYKHVEKEAGKRCKELQNFKDGTEAHLKREVARHYAAFLRASREIKPMQDELAALRAALGRATAGLGRLDRLDLARAAQTELVELVARAKRDQDAAAEAEAEAAGATAGAAGAAPPGADPLTPQWLAAAPAALAGLVRERRHAQAAALAQRARAYGAGLHPGGRAAAAAAPLLAKVDAISEELATRIYKGVSEQQHEVWRHAHHSDEEETEGGSTSGGTGGGAAQLLAALGRADWAAQAELRGRSAALRRALRAAAAAAGADGGAAGAAARRLSELFFARAARAVRAALGRQGGGGGGGGGPAPAALVLWVDGELAHYAALLGRQIRATQILGADLARKQTLYSAAFQQQVISGASSRNLSLASVDEHRQQTEAPSYRRQRSFFFQSADGDAAAPSASPGGGGGGVRSPRRADARREADRQVALLRRKSVAMEASRANPRRSSVVRAASSGPAGAGAADAMQEDDGGAPPSYRPHAAGVVALAAECLEEAFGACEAHLAPLGLPLAGRLAARLRPALADLLRALARAAARANASAVQHEKWNIKDYKIPTFLLEEMDEQQNHTAQLVPSTFAMVCEISELIEQVDGLAAVGSEQSAWVEWEDFYNLILLLPEICSTILLSYVQECLACVESSQKSGFKSPEKVKNMQTCLKELITKVIPKISNTLGSICTAEDENNMADCLSGVITQAEEAVMQMEGCTNSVHSS